MSNGAFELRPAIAADLPQITAIYAHYVLTHSATFEIAAPDLIEMQRRLEALRQSGYPYWVAVAQGAVLGYCYIGTYRARVAYAHTAENAVYVAPEQARRGVGVALLNRCLEECPARGIREVVAVIGDSANRASIALHERCGFRHVGTLTAVGFKFGRWLDTVIMQRSLYNL
ncbi:MAG: N-acetyltransferase family protein [Steroidobacteraceae bacterium]